jgi:demethylmenaquinone methyltransferase/2-methoxy-6-polyprenyl-1,4-benzoquinol methylase
MNTITEKTKSGVIPSRKKVWHMFDRIARRYDMLNRLLSFHQDVRWRRKMAGYLPQRGRLNVLDVATGTADQIIALHDEADNLIRSSTGVDMAKQMLEIGVEKLKKRGIISKVSLEAGDAMELHFESKEFDVVTISFGIRNVSDVMTALEEMYRVLKSDGRVLILEFSLPRIKLIRKLYLFYFRHILPPLGGIISGDNQAYRYLNETVETFPHGIEFSDILYQAGFSRVSIKPLTLGIATIYCGDKIG